MKLNEQQHTEARDDLAFLRSRLDREELLESVGYATFSNLKRAVDSGEIAASRFDALRTLAHRVRHEEESGLLADPWARVGREVEDVVDTLDEMADRLDYILANGAPPIVKKGLYEVRARLSETLSAAGRTNATTFTTSSTFTAGGSRE